MLGCPAVRGGGCASRAPRRHSAWDLFFQYPHVDRCFSVRRDTQLGWLGRVLGDQDGVPQNLIASVLQDRYLSSQCQSSRGILAPLQHWRITVARLCLFSPSLIARVNLPER